LDRIAAKEKNKKIRGKLEMDAQNC